MDIKEKLETLRANQAGVDHLVYGDASAEMVLFSSSQKQKSQEAHDKLLSNATRIFSGQGAGLTDASDDGAPKQLIVSDDAGLWMVTGDGGQTGEILVLALTRAADISAVGPAAAAVYSLVSDHGG